MASNQAVMILLVVSAAALSAPALASTGVGGAGMKPKANDRDIFPNSSVTVPSTYSKYSRNLTDDQDAGESG
jgi:hypothetical protein